MHKLMFEVGVACEKIRNAIYEIDELKSPEKEMGFLILRSAINEILMCLENTENFIEHK